MAGRRVARCPSAGTRNEDVPGKVGKPDEKRRTTIRRLKRTITLGLKERFCGERGLVLYTRQSFAAYDSAGGLIRIAASREDYADIHIC
jgi:hypothetical protein